MKDHFPTWRPNGLRWPHVQLLVAENHKLLFCPIAKNACTSLKRLMVSVSHIEHKRLLLASDIHGNIDGYRTGAKLGDYDLAYARDVMQSPGYYKFAVFRDPFSRLASAYREKFVINRSRPANQIHTSPVMSAVQGTDAPDFKRGITFAQFIRHITAQDPESLDPHWKPQTLYLRGVDYDRIYRMDRLDLLLEDLSQRVGYPLELEQNNRSHRGRARYVARAAELYADQLKAARRIDKHSFMDSALMYRIAAYFADDYRQYYGPQFTSPSPLVDLEHGNCTGDLSVA